MTVRHGGHTIEPAPYQLADNLRWAVSAYILVDIDNRTTSTQFTASLQCHTREEAMRHSIEYGRQLIDGKVPGVPTMT